VAKNYVLAMAIAGTFAGLAGVVDMLGFQYRYGQLDITNSNNIGFIGIAVALLGRNKAIGIALSALLFASLLYGTSTRSIDASVFKPELAGNLTWMIQALVLLFIGADVLILYVWNARKKLRRSRPPAQPAQPTQAAGQMVARAENPLWPGFGARQIAIGGIVLGCFAFLVALPPITARAPWWPPLLGILAIGAGVWAVSRGVGRVG